MVDPLVGWGVMFYSLEIIRELQFLYMYIIIVVTGIPAYMLISCKLIFI